MRYIAKTLVILGFSIVSICSIETGYVKAQGYSKWALALIWNQCINSDGYPYYSVLAGKRAGVSCVFNVGSGDEVSVLTDGAWWEGIWYGKGRVLSTDGSSMLCYSDYWKNSKPGFCGLASDIKLYKHYYTNMW